MEIKIFSEKGDLIKDLKEVSYKDIYIKINGKLVNLKTFNDISVINWADADMSYSACFERELLINYNLTSFGGDDAFDLSHEISDIMEIINLWPP